MRRILFVDDEPQILKSLIRLFMDSKYDIITAESGLQALEILQSTEVNMIISDMRMPGMDGYQLLTKIKEKYPRIMRVILSGYSDDKIVLNALQKNVAKLYMFKPWDNDQLTALVDQMFETEYVLNSVNLLALINNIESLPAMKSNYQRILRLIDEDMDMSVIGSAIESDASIAAKILHVANSAFFNAKTGSVKQAVTYIGLEYTKKLVMSTSLIDAMQDSSTDGDMIASMWKVSFTSNRLLDFLYVRHLNKKVPDAFSTAALLQNIGSVLLLKFFRADYLRLRQVSRNSNRDYIDSEKEIFKVTHAEAGAYLLGWWDFPYPFVEAALYHHEPFHKSIVNRELLLCTHIANKYAVDMVGDKKQYDFQEEAFEALNIKKSDFEDSLVDFNI